MCYCVQLYLRTSEKRAITNYGLDHASYVCAPGLAWDAMLLNTKVELDLIADLEIMDMIERQQRGGLCYVGSTRYVEANSKYLENYDPSNKPSNYIMYWDANNLYGWAMVQHLPYEGLSFVSHVSLSEILQTADDARYGYIIECNLFFPPEIHDKLKELAPAPETLTPNMKWFSD